MSAKFWNLIDSRNGSIRGPEVDTLARSPEVDALVARIAQAVPALSPYDPSWKGHEEYKGTIGFVLAKNGAFMRYSRSDFCGGADSGTGETSKALAEALYKDSLGNLGASAIRVRFEEEGLLMELRKYHCGQRWLISLRGRDDLT
ncbi:hypothetical protein FWH13_00905 [Candidatus Saccharibacteria bacterium]|nr:hypothetical protein [Candidatus Saccharibacteria bacterium]